MQWSSKAKILETINNLKQSMEEIDGVEDDNNFPQEEIDTKVQEVAEEVLKEAMWDELKVPVWIN